MPTRRDQARLRWRAVRRQVLARRRGLAALCAAAAVATALHSLRPVQPETRTVVAAARDLPAGTVLAATDLTSVALPSGAVPSGSVREAAGRTLAAPIRAGEPVTDVRLVGAPLVAAYPGRVAVPLRLPDPGMVDLLRVGDRIDLVAADPQGGAAVEVARDLVVMALPDAAEETVSGVLPGRLVLLAVPAPLRTRIAQAAVAKFLTFTYTR